ncbi:oxidoreductase [Sphaerisporangium melleum]|uniref:nitric oxide dioxygenase n=1 Tax=Sphaerisporangium melleum TaxID=321316 RepID=A0A917REZ9_9ACTN|nr:globin domain-containing protein [Sphaerisporangium melleum]GGL05023.1 oxidoreductase [Sphaerisporangium melleum]GII73943.1 oxidoreductase [Sphaerisporangium melleum]
MTIDIGLIRQSWALVEPVADKVAMHFYAKLFADYPRIREMFPPAMDVQRDRLLHALTRVVLNLDDTGGVLDYLGQLARDHRKYGVLPEHYPAVGRCLVIAMRANAGDAWRSVYDAAWIDAYQFIADVMIKAADQDAAYGPSTWEGVVVGHEMRTREIAVLTVEPTQPYAYKAGQYATVQTPHWPKVWRPYSIANAPRRDNRLTFHVRVVSGGWVSTALAHHTRVGDTLLLGPPRGSLVLERASTPHLVFIAGGTGLAPLKALIEESMWLPDRPSIDLFHGVRHPGDAYDVGDLRDLRGQHRRLRVVQAVADAPAGWRREMAVDALLNHRVALDGDVFLCGPPDMVRVSTARLLHIGVPPHLIHTEFAPGAPTLVPS